MDAREVRVQRGLPEECRGDAARLYDEAFGDKFSRAVRSAERRRSLLAPVLQPRFALTATFGDELVGLAGVQTPEGSFTGGLDFDALREHLGWLRALWAAFVLSQYERTPEPGQLVMETESYPYLRWFFGFGGSTTMEREVQ